MKKIFALILGTVVAFSATVANAIIPPSHVSAYVVKLGHLTDDQVPVTFKDKTQVFTISGCETNWVDNQEFYALVSSKDDMVVVVRKDLMDFAWEKYPDWNVVLAALLKYKAVCEVK